MPQGPLKTSNVSAGLRNKLNLTAGATQVIKATPGRVGRLIINTAGTASAWSIWDASTAGGATAANLIWTAAFGASSVAVSSIVIIDFPCASGIVITVPTTGVASLSFS